ncbi:PAS domain S-box protein [Thermodesulfobacteriota bacterium]
MAEKLNNETLEKKVAELEKELSKCKKDMEEIKDSEEQYRTLIDSSPDPVVIHSGGIILFVNEAFADLGGLFSSEEAIGKSIFEVLPPAERPDNPDDHDNPDNPHEKVIRDNESYSMLEVPLMRPDGYEVIFEVSARNITYQGQDAVLLVHRDITKRKEAEDRLKESEEMYRKLFEHAGFAISLVDAETGKAIEVNRRAHESLGFTEEESKRSTVIDFEERETSEEILEHFKLIIKKGSDLFETQHRTKEGEIRDMLISAVAIKLGGKDYIHNISIDITESKQAEKAMRESEVMYRKLFEHAGVGIILTDPETGERVEFNRKAHEMFGYNREEFVKLKVSQTDVDKNQEEISRHHREIIEKGSDVFEVRRKTKNNEIRDTWWSSIPVSLGGKYYIQSIGIDITDRKQAEKALRESEERFRLLFNSSANGIFVHDYEGNIIEVSERACENLGYPHEEIISMNIRDIDVEIVSMDHREQFWNKLQPNQPITFESAHRRKDGTTYPVEVSCVLIESQDRKLIMGIDRDISKRKEAEEALRESEERYRMLFEHAGFSITLSDPETGEIVEFNKKTLEILGYTHEEFKDLTLEDINAVMSSEEIIRGQKIVVEKGPKVFETKEKTKTGNMLEVLVSAIPIRLGGKEYIQSLRIDITGRKQAEEEREKLQKQFEQAQKMEAVGTLAGGMAHDFNNLLMGIQGRTSLMLLDTESSHPYAEHLSGIEDYVKNAADLTRQLLGFARGGKYEVVSTDMNEFIRNQNCLFGRTKKEISIHEKFEKDLLPVDVDRGQMAQVLLNLYVNAWQAMPAGGEIYISTENIKLHEDYVEPYGVGSGRYVKISVTDTGAGMDKTTQQRIFEPFFTTKEMGRGTGLGLASVYGIIKNHGGFINVYSERGEGTTFNIYLRVSGGDIIQEKDKTKELLRGSETVLFVDDEEMIIDVGRQMLQELGYTVIPAMTGNEAIELYSEHEDKIDFVILDMIMPDISGGIVFDRLKEQHPDIKVLLSSGYSLNGQASKILNRGCNGFIQKPFTMESLSRKIREVLSK